MSPPKYSQITDIVNIEPGRDNPILLSFQNAEMGYKEDVHCFRATDVNRTQSIEEMHKHQNMAIAVCDRHMYHGYLNEGLPADAMHSYIAIRNKKNGKMRLIQLAECTMLNTCYNDPANIVALGDDQQTSEQRWTIARKFAGKAAIRAMDRNERAGQNIDVINESISATVEAFDEDDLLAGVADDDEFAKSKVERELILISMKPPINHAAKNASELYLLEDLIPSSVRTQLRATSLALIKRDPETIQLASVYLTNKLKAIVQSAKEPDSEASINVGQICLFMDALARLITAPRNSRNLKKLVLSPFSTELDAEIKRSFSQINAYGQVRTQYSLHKALMYYLALAFLLEGDGTRATLNVDQIHASLNVGRDELLKFASFIGATYNSATGTLTLKQSAVGSTKSEKKFHGRLFYGRKK